ncbi:hypothetical protein LK09_15345 [Microbacterium mangrovi]|uniref:IrrE N-terminal-like domain-containing protein n=1 Tax=Microbacterium mangrovi TaxID=1348253 RepID=A0A0B2A048_9MICO|nr:hypothetical protein [Microbacterium mangrovi]KHK96361.1 hypothetical protein LK09_15345 [Microbacterium mangrovi]
MIGVGLAEIATARMFGVDAADTPDARDYDPWEHADLLGARIVANPTLPGSMVAAYSHRRRVIFVRPNLQGAVERCAVAHELVHWEHGDVGTTRWQERRADRISTLRLIRPRRLEEAASVTSDPGVMALDLQVTERVMRLYARMARDGILPLTLDA